MPFLRFCCCSWPAGPRWSGRGGPIAAIPDALPFGVSRPDLVARLATGHQPIMLVTGPAGSGKTQLVASWALTSDETVAWVTLEDEDDQASTFWTYVIEALRRAGLSFPEFAPLVPAETVDRSVLNRIAGVLCGLTRPMVLVLDGLRLVLVGRWDPPMPLYRYRLAGARGRRSSAG